MRRSLAIAIIIALISSVSGNVSCQDSEDKLQLGVGLRLTGELLYSMKFDHDLAGQHGKLWFNWKLALTSGINYRMKVENYTYLTPSFNIDALIFQGGGGAADLTELRAGTPFKRSLNPLLILTVALQASHNYILGNENWKEIQAKPAYYFSNFSNPSLTNPSIASVSVGTAWVFAKRWRQQCAVINAAYRNMQLQYYNDGGLPVPLSYLGDTKDRYFTGGLILSYFNQQRRDLLQNIEISYHKFTAFENNNYEIATDFSFTDVIYSPLNEAYNRSKLEAKFTNAEDNYGISAVLYDKYTLDLQHKIHFFRYFSHHISPYPPQLGITGFGQFVNNK